MAYACTYRCRLSATVEQELLTVVGVFQNSAKAYNPRVPEDGWRAVEAPNSHVKASLLSQNRAAEGSRVLELVAIEGKGTASEFRLADQLPNVCLTDLQALERALLKDLQRNFSRTWKSRDTVASGGDSVPSASVQQLPEAAAYKIA